MGEAYIRKKRQTKEIADYVIRVMLTSSSYPEPVNKAPNSPQKTHTGTQTNVSASVTFPPPVIPSSSTEFKYEISKHEPIPYDDVKDDYDDGVEFIEEAQAYRRENVDSVAICPKSTMDVLPTRNTVSGRMVTRFFRRQLLRPRVSPIRTSLPYGRG